jgi:hypothetical protein
MNKTVVIGASAVTVGAGALIIGQYYLPRQTAAAWAAGDADRATTLADHMFSIMDYAAFFALMIFGGFALVASAPGLCAA